MDLLFVFGVGLLAGAAVAAATRLALRRAGTRAVVSFVAGAAAAATWLVFVIDWLLYNLAEKRPFYYRFSDYVEYRRALEGIDGVAVGLGYAVLAGSLVAGAAVVHRRIGPRWAAAVALAAAGSIALPVVVPAALPRAEYGKDPVFRVSRSPYEDPTSGRPTVCFAYGVERPDDAPATGEGDAELCVELRPTPTARALVRNPAPVDAERLSVYDIVDELNEPSVLPFDQVEDVGIEGLEIARADLADGSAVSHPAAAHPAGGRPAPPPTTPRPRRTFFRWQGAWRRAGPEREPTCPATTLGACPASRGRSGP